MSDQFDAMVRAYRGCYGEPQYRYFKKHVAWSKPRRGPGFHISPIGDGQEVTQEEYEANIAETKLLAGEAFMSRLERSYWAYDRKMIKPGWREKLIEAVKDYPDAVGSPGTTND